MIEDAEDDDNSSKACSVGDSHAYRHFKSHHSYVLSLPPAWLSSSSSLLPLPFLLSDDAMFLLVTWDKIARNQELEVVLQMTAIVQCYTWLFQNAMNRDQSTLPVVLMLSQLQKQSKGSCCCCWSIDGHVIARCQIKDKTRLTRLESTAPFFEIRTFSIKQTYFIHVESATTLKGYTVTFGSSHAKPTMLHHSIVGYLTSCLHLFRILRQPWWQPRCMCNSSSRPVLYA